MEFLKRIVSKRYCRLIKPNNEVIFYFPCKKQKNVKTKETLMKLVSKIIFGITETYKSEEILEKSEKVVLQIDSEFDLKMFRIQGRHILNIQNLNSPMKVLLHTTPPVSISEKALQKFKAKQAAMQVGNGVPVYLLKGLPDKILFGTTVALMGLGIVNIVHVFAEHIMDT